MCRVKEKMKDNVSRKFAKKYCDYLVKILNNDPPPGANLHGF